MEAKKKERYEVPSITVVELKFENAILEGSYDPNRALRGGYGEEDDI